MKKLLTIIYFLISTSSFAQFQRLAILPTLSSVLITKSEAGQFATYCVDYFRKAPKYNTQYRSIISGEPTKIRVTKTNGSVLDMSLESGLSGDRPILQMHATGSDFSDGIYSGITMSINPQRTDIKSVKVNPIQKSKVIAENAADTRDLVSDIIFKTFGENIPQEDFWRKSLSIEILKVNNKLAFDNTGRLNSSTLKLIEKLEEEPLLESIDENSIYSLIQGNKIKITESGSLADESKNVLQNLKSVQDKIFDYGLYEHYSNESIESLSLEEVIKKIQEENNLEITGTPTTELMTYLDNYGKPYEIVKDYELNGKSNNVIAASSSYYNAQYVIRMDDKNYLFDTYSKPSLLNSNNIDELEGKFKDDVNSHSSLNQDINYIYFGSINNTTKELKAQIGTSEKVIKLNSVDTYDDIISVVDDEIKNNPEKKNYVLSRDMFTKGKIGELDKATATNLFGDKFIQGKNISIEDRTWINYTELIRELKIKYPDKNFYLGGNFYQDEFSITDVPKIKSGNDIAAYIAPKSLDITFDQVNSMKNKLSSSGIMVHELDLDFANIPEEISQANILLLSGHKESAYEEFLKKLADKGLLRDKVVAVFSCNETGTANLNSYLIKKGYAKKVIFFPSKIDITAVNAVFSELTELTKNITIPEGIALDKLIDEAVEKALNNPKYEDLKDEIKLFKEFINQTSFNAFPNNQKLMQNG